MNSLDYKTLKKFIKQIETNYNFYSFIGKQILKDVKYNRTRRCTCRKFNCNLNINYQCPNPITTISNKCYHCDKYNDYLGFVNIYPITQIIKQYETYGQQHKIVFKQNSINIGTCKLYIHTPYLKIKITDYEQYTSIILFLIPDTNDSNKGILKDKYSNHIGTYSYWIDTYNCVSPEYKNEHQCVLDPVSYIPLFEYNLKEKSIYHELTNKIYRMYTFDAPSHTLISTQNITPF